MLGLEKIKGDYNILNAEYENLLLKNAELKEANADIKNELNRIVMLYDAAKEICKSLDQETVFRLFKNELDKQISIKECVFVKNDLVSPEHKDALVLPLEINKNPVGYLMVEGIREEDKEIFNILSQQFLLGIKRALLYRRVQELAITDGLTGVFNRRYYLERLKDEIERSKNFKFNFCLFMIDVDHFKEYNDRYGHLVGDAVLKEVSKAIKENIRQIDLFGRYGGEEFSIALTETDRGHVKLAAERIREAVEERPFKVYDEELKITISIGISVFPTDAQDCSILIEKADQALYQAKERGRNRVCMYGGGS